MDIKQYTQDISVSLLYFRKFLINSHISHVNNI